MEWDAVQVIIGCAVPAFLAALLVGMRSTRVPIRFPVVAIVFLGLLALISPSYLLGLGALVQLSGTRNIPEITGFVGVAIVFLAAALTFQAVVLRYLVPVSLPRAIGAGLVSATLILPLFVGTFLVQQKVSAALAMRRVEREADTYRLALVQMIEEHELPVPYGYWTPELTLTAAERRQLNSVKPIHAGTLHHLQERVKSVPAQVWDGQAWVDDRELPRTPWFKLTEQVARDVAQQLHEQGYEVYLSQGIQQVARNPGHVVTNAAQEVPRTYHDPILYAISQQRKVLFVVESDPAPWASAPRIQFDVNPALKVPASARRLTFPLTDRPLFDCRVDAELPSSQH